MKQPVDTLVERLSARDEDINRDGFSLMLDTSGQGLYGYIFGLNLGGTKQDGKLAPESVMSYEWDGAWRGATQALDDGWSAELFIPWSILSMPESSGQRRLAVFVAKSRPTLTSFGAGPSCPNPDLGLSLVSIAIRFKRWRSDNNGKPTLMLQRPLT